MFIIHYRISLIKLKNCAEFELAICRLLVRRAAERFSAAIQSVRRVSCIWITLNNNKILMRFLCPTRVFPMQAKLSHLALQMSL